MLKKLGEGSFEQVGLVLGLDRKDDKSVNGVLRALVTRWLDNASATAPAATVEGDGCDVRSLCDSLRDTGPLHLAEPEWPTTSPSASERPNRKSL